MKTKTFVLIAVMILAVLIIAGSCATGKKAYVVQEDEELFGTWINPDYDEKMVQATKFIYEPDGVLRGFETANTTKETMTAKFTITDKWIDDEGIIWYKWLLTDIRGSVLKTHSDYYYLGKISDSGRVFEFSYSGSDYPPEVNPDNLRYNHRIYYRQE